MGQIRIQLEGSFNHYDYGEKVAYFSAQENGHAQSITEAMRWLALKLGKAIAHDHKLHDEGASPDSGFGAPPPQETP